MKKKLLVTASTFPRWEGDTEPRFVLDLSASMTEYYDVTVLVPASPGAKEREILNGVNVIRYHYFPMHRWETLCAPGAIVPRIKEKKIRALLVPFLFLSLFFHLIYLLPKYDVVHAHWLIPQGIVQGLFSKPYIVTGHGGDISAFNKGIIKKFKKKCLEKAGSVVVVSKYKERELLEIFPDIKTQIISMGVDSEKFNRDKNYIENYFQQGDKKVVLFVGRLADIKGVEYLIDAMSGMENKKLVIVGDGPERERLEARAASNNSDIKFLGSKTHTELKTIFASADVLVVPSITDAKGAQEGLPTVIMEAMSSGLPVVGTATGGIPDIIADGKNGYLVEEKDANAIARAINKVFASEEGYACLHSNALETGRRYDYKEIAKKYNKKYEEAMQK